MQDQTVYEFGPVRIDSSTRKLTRNGECVKLQARRLEALLLLVQKRNQAVSKAELLATIWPGTYVDESNLPVVISAIRRAIGDDGRSQKCIETVSKFGYRFVAEVTEIRMLETGASIASRSDFDDHAIPPANPVALSEPPRQSRSRGTRYVRVSIVAGCVVAAATLFLLDSPRQRGGKEPVAVTSTSQAIPETHGDSRSPSPADADTWYQRGRYTWNLQTKDGFLQSIEYYRKALAADPNYAAAYAGLAKSYVTLPSYSGRLNGATFDRAREAAEKAVSLDDRLADAHIALGMVLLIADRDFARAGRELRRAVDLDPHSSLAEGQLALYLTAVGQNDEAVVHARKAKALDPLPIRAATDLGVVLYYGRRFAEAESAFKETLDLDPYYNRAKLQLAKTYLSLGRFDDARRLLSEILLFANHDPVADGLMAQARALGGDTDGARTILSALEQRARTTYVAPLSLAFGMVGLGRLNDTLAYLRKAREDRTMGVLFLKVEPSWEPLRMNPDFRRLVSDIGPADRGIRFVLKPASLPGTPVEPH